MRDEKLDLMRSIVALDMGIIPLDIPINEALSSLTPEESKKTRRKFRKIRRKLAKKLFSSYKKVSKLRCVTKSDIRREIDFLAFKKLK